MKDLSDFSSNICFFFIILLKTMKYTVYSFVCLIPATIYLKMIPREFLDPIELARTQTLCIHKITKIVVIFKY